MHNREPERSRVTGYLLIPLSLTSSPVPHGPALHQPFPCWRAMSGRRPSCGRPSSSHCSAPIKDNLALVWMKQVSILTSFGMST